MIGFVTLHCVRGTWNYAALWGGVSSQIAVVFDTVCS